MNRDPRARFADVRELAGALLSLGGAVEWADYARDFVALDGHSDHTHVDLPRPPANPGLPARSRWWRGKRIPELLVATSLAAACAWIVAGSRVGPPAGAATELLIPEATSGAGRQVPATAIAVSVSTPPQALPREPGSGAEVTAQTREPGARRSKKRGLESARRPVRPTTSASPRIPTADPGDDDAIDPFAPAP